MSALRPHGFALRCLSLSAALALGACDPGADVETPADASFGVAIVYRDAGLDGSVGLDAALEGGANARVRFVHAFPNIAALVVCHDPDGRGPAPAYPLREDSRLLRADYGLTSPELALPPLDTGELTLHREPSPRDGGSADAGSSDAGTAELCSAALLEATIPLPIPSAWFAQLAERGRGAGFEPRFAATFSAARPLTLIGTGLALNDAAVESDRDGGLMSAFGPRALLQEEPPADGPGSFSLTLLHAIPNLTGADAGAFGESAPVRVCITEGTRVRPVFPQAPNGISFRMRAPLGGNFNPRVAHTLRVFVQTDFDSEGKNCGTTGLRPLAMETFPQGRFQENRSYTLALIGAVSAAELCSASRSTFVRPGCPRPADRLAPRLVELEEAR